MKTKLALSILFLITFNSKAQNQEEKSVVESFETYKDAILNDKGEIAVSSVDSRTLSYYSNILNQTKEADSTKLNSLGVIDKFTVLTMRHKASKEEILSFNGKGVLEYAIKNGMVGKNSVANTTIGEVIIDGDFAKGQLVKNGQKAPFYFHFYKENNIWKIDITSLFSAGVMAFKKMIEDSGKNENDFFLYILEAMTGKKPSPEIWNPIK